MFEQGVCRSIDSGVSRKLNAARIFVTLFDQEILVKLEGDGNIDRYTLSIIDTDTGIVFLVVISQKSKSS